jgi:hypothetical protein
MATMDVTKSFWSSKTGRLLREPMVHFFLLGAVVFLAHRILAGDPRRIVMNAGLRSDLVRQARDLLGRPPTGDEIASAIQTWKREEALYFEAIRLGLDRDDPLVRNFLVDRMREHLWRRASTPEPSAGDLDRWLAEHRGLYEKPLVYEFEYLVIPRDDPAAEKRRERILEALGAGATPTSLALRTVVAKVGRDAIEAELGKEVAAGIAALTIGSWRRLENARSLLLARMIHIEGGLPAPEELRARLIVDFQQATQRQAVDRAVGAIVDQYRFEERGP